MAGNAAAPKQSAYGKQEGKALVLQGQSTDGSEGAVLARLWHLFESLIITALKEKCWRKYLISLNKHEYHVFINEIILLGAILALFLFILAPPLARLRHW